MGRHNGFAWILRRLRLSWQESDPGKSSDVYFFLTKGGDWAIAKELLDPETEICKTDEQSAAYKKERERGWHGAKHTKVLQRYAVIPLSDALTAECPVCHLALPVIEHYAQTRDSPQGDNWLKERFLLCLNCDKWHKLKSENSQYRF